MPTGSLDMPSTRPTLAVNVRPQSLQCQSWLPHPVCPLRTMLMEPRLTQALAGSSWEPVPNMSSYTMERRGSIARRRPSSSSSANPSRTPLTNFATLLYLPITLL